MSEDHQKMPGAKSGNHLGEDRGRGQVALGWFLLVWAVFLAWRYASAVLKVRSVPEFLGLTLLATALVVGVPGALLAHLGRRRGRRIALSALLALGGAPAVYLVVASGVGVAVAATLFLLAAAYGYGAAVTGWAGLDDEERGWQGVPLAVTVGLAVLIVLAIGAGTAGALTRPVTAAVGAVGVILAGVRLRRVLSGRRAAPALSVEPVGIQWWWGWVVLVLVGLVGAVAPEVRHDALAVHLPIAREFAVRGAIVEMRQNIGSYFTLNGAILYAIGMTLVAGEAVPRLLHFAAGVLSSLLVYCVGTRLWHPRVGLGAAVVVASTPLILWGGGGAHTDLWRVLFSTGAVAALARFRERPGVSAAAVLGLLGGAAAGVRLTTLIVVLPVAVFAVVFAKGRDSGTPGRVPAVIAFVLGAALSGAYWYIRSWMLTGNPVFPVMNAVFKSPYWALENRPFSLDPWGMGTGLADLLALPWRATFLPDRFVEGSNLGPAYLALLPAILLAAVRGRIPRWLLWIAGAAVLLWFFGAAAQYLRYLLPVIPVLAVIGVAGLLAGPMPPRMLVAAGGALVLIVSVAAAGWVSSGPANFPLGVAVGKVSKADHISAHVAGFRVAEFARRTLPADARVYGAGEDFYFYYDRFFVPISWLGRLYDRTLPRRVLRARTGRELQQALSRAGLTHLVLHRDHPMVARRRRPDGWIAREAFWEEGPRLEYAYREYYLFDLSPPPGAGPRFRGEDLLQNGGMSGEVGAAPAGWDRHGGVGLVSAGPGAAAAAHVRIGPGGYIVQRLAVTPDRLYVLESEARGASLSTSARLFIQWFDDGGRVLDYTTWRQVTVGPDWKRYAMACTAPRRARTALVWLIAAEGGEVEFDRAAFYELR